MSATDDYCELCDLPRSQCVHGMPAPAPQPAKKTPPKPRHRPAPARTVRTTSPPAKPVHRRWTPPEAFKPLIVAVLQQAGGSLEAEEALLELEVLAEERLLAGDRETTPQGEPRWQYAARRARAELIDEGVMVKGRPGLWELGKGR